MTKGKTPLQEVLERVAPEYFLFHCRCAILVSSPQASAGFLSIHSTISSQGLISRLSEVSSLLDFHNTLGNDSVLQCVLHQFLNGRAGTPLFEIGCSSNSIYHCLCIQRSLIKSVVLPGPPSMLCSMSFKTSWHQI